MASPAKHNFDGKSGNMQFVCGVQEDLIVCRRVRHLPILMVSLSMEVLMARPATYNFDGAVSNIQVSQKKSCLA
jgi:hypothetical protein